MLDRMEMHLILAIVLLSAAISGATFSAISVHKDILSKHHTRLNNLEEKCR